jgi:anhydro-N-acetylmuramic acid kinase
MILIGLMSGTSLDGISAAAVRLQDRDGRTQAELLAFEVCEYTTDQRRRLARGLTEGTPDEYCRLNFDLGEWLSAAAIRVIAEAGIPRGEIAAIASHGQTVWHVPGHSTWQMGESSVIAERAGLRVVSDFRVADVAAGGQGAPLVPIADALLFSAPTQWRALQNLGGIGNVGVVPPGGALGGVRAFDTGPGVVVIDGVVRGLTPGARFDEDGALARAGTAIPEVVRDALSAPYFRAPPPKSTGRELFSPDYVRDFIERCRQFRPGASTADMVATAVAFTAESVADAYRRFVPEPVADVLVSGGGSKNPALVAAIRAAIAPLTVRCFDEVYFDSEAKEAVAFALLGYLYLTGRAANVPSATGARGPRVLGKLTPAGGAAADERLA